MYFFLTILYMSDVCICTVNSFLVSRMLKTEYENFKMQDFHLEWLENYYQQSYFTLYLLTWNSFDFKIKKMIVKVHSYLCRGVANVARCLATSAKPSVTVTRRH